MAYSLRPYQATAVARTRAELRAGRHSVLIVSPTGSGKTVIACHIVGQADGRGTRTLFLAHRTELIEQCAAKLGENGVRHGIIKAGYDPDPYKDVQIASVQTYARRAARLRHKYRLVIIDEAHHAVANGYQRVLDCNPGATVLGLTATPYRADGRGLKGTFETLVEVETIESLIEQGHLVPSRVYLAQRQASLRGVHTRGGDYQLDELGERMNRPWITDHIVASWNRYAYGRTSVCFATTVDHSRTLTVAFLRAGVQAEHLDGSTPPGERAAILERLATGHSQLVVNCVVLTEGWDCPPCSAIILARPTKSRGLWRQMIGRTLRPCPEIGKRDCLILDHARATDLHGYITDPDRISLEEGIQPPGGRTKYKCRACGAVLSSRPRYCPACGIDTRGGQQGELPLGGGGDGYEMIEVRPDTYKPKRPPMTAGLIEHLFFRDLAAAFRKGHSPNVAAYRYKHRTGKWPGGDLWARSPHKTTWERQGGKAKRVWVSEMAKL